MNDDVNIRRIKMVNAFLANFIAYLVVFLVFVGCALAAAFVGIALRKRKNAKEEVLNGEISESEA